MTKPTKTIAVTGVAIAVLGGLAGAAAGLAFVTYLAVAVGSGVAGVGSALARAPMAAYASAGVAALTGLVAVVALGLPGTLIAAVALAAIVFSVVAARMFAPARPLPAATRAMLEKHLSFTGESVSGAHLAATATGGIVAVLAVDADTTNEAFAAQAGAIRSLAKGPSLAVVGVTPGSGISARIVDDRTWIGSADRVFVNLTVSAATKSDPTIAAPAKPARKVRHQGRVTRIDD